MNDGIGTKHVVLYRHDLSMKIKRADVKYNLIIDSDATMYVIAYSYMVLFIGKVTQV